MTRFIEVNATECMTTTLLVFTDLDGTLLDHYSYDFSAASDALNSLKTLGIPCVLNTSKTYAELLELRGALRHKDPFIVENGAAVYLPVNSRFDSTPEWTQRGDYWVKAFGPDRQQLIATAKTMKSRFDFVGYHELTVEQLMEHTGLDAHTATLSMEREFTEPLIWNDSNNALAEFRGLMAEKGIKVQKGGRFVHLMGQSCDKAVAMKWLTERYQNNTFDVVKSIALGDGENDVEMISKANISVVVRSPVHVPPEIPNRNDVWITDSYGPKGWSEAINQALTNEGFI